jgi:hypothetical protein
VDDRHARNVARDRRRVWAVLPTQMDWRPAVDAEYVARELKLPLRVVCHHLHDLEGAGLASRAGGLWRRRGRMP